MKLQITLLTFYFLLLGFYQNQITFENAVPYEECFDEAITFS